MGTRDEPYLTSVPQHNSHPLYPSQAENNFHDQMATKNHVIIQPDMDLYDTPTTLELSRVDSETYGGAPFVFNGALRKTPKVQIERQQSRLGKLQHSVSTSVKTYGAVIWNVFVFTLLILYTAYFIWAIVYDADAATPLIVLTCLTVFCIIYSFVSTRYGETLYNHFFHPLGVWLSKVWVWARWIILPGILIGAICYLAFSVVQEMRQLQSISGNVIFIGLLYLTCKHPNRINWRPVLWGFTLQFVIGIVVLRWKPGYDAVSWFSDQLMKFIYYSLEGASVVFGDPFLLLHSFVMVSMPMLIYVGAVMGGCYYMGWTQIAASKLGWLVQATMGTTAIESLGVAGNIFLNGMDVMLMLKAYIPRLTQSEFFCFLVGNHSTVAGFAFPLFVMYGAPPEYLLSAAVMSAPAAIAAAKLSYPETEESITKRQEDVKLERGSETSVAEAIANGSAVAGKTVMAVLVNYIAFLGLLGFINSTLSWLGGRVGFSELSFGWICSYIFYPISIIMGVDPSEAREVAKLVGYKVFATELLAFEELGVSIRAGVLSDRSASITTYALSGFSSLSTLAIAVGVWNTVVPSKTKDMTSMMMRAVVCANVSCFLTACVAGLLFDQSLVPEEDNPLGILAPILGAVFNIMPNYKEFLGLLPGYNF